MNINFVIKRIIVVYTLIGSLLCLGWFVSRLGVSGIYNYLFPYAITVLIWFFYIFSSVLFLFKSSSQRNSLLVQLSLILQTVQFVVMGYSFKNYFGPYIGVGLTNVPDFQVILSVKGFDYLLSNGMKPNKDEISFVINLVSLLSLLLFKYLPENSQQAANRDPD